MRKLLLIAACVALAACGQKPAKPAEKPKDAVSAPAIPTLASFAGTYDYTLADGTTGITKMKPDGTFTDLMGDEAVKGVWSVTDDKVCIDPEGDASHQRLACYAIGQPDGDGVQTATTDDGIVVKIKRKGNA